MQRQCGATKPNGERCALPATGPQTTCWSHSSQNAAQRRRTASRGGRSKASKETADLKGELKKLRARVDSGDLDPTKANTIIRAISAEVDIVRLERQVRLEDDLAARIEELKRGEHSDTP